MLLVIACQLTINFATTLTLDKLLTGYAAHFNMCKCNGISDDSLPTSERFRVPHLPEADLNLVRVETYKVKFYCKGF